MIRPTVLAGSWYPADRVELENSIASYMSQAEELSITGQIIGLISPHAGHFYSGRTAASGYRQIPQEIDQVVILSPTHHTPAGEYVITECTHYSTLLGEVAVNRDLVKALQEYVDISFIGSDTEHAIEIQLPFLQYHLNSFNLLPIMIGQHNIYKCEDIINGLIEICKGQNILFIASSDLHHIENYRLVCEKDQEVIEVLETFNLKKIRKRLQHRGCSVCGKVPISIVMDICSRLGATQLKILDHTTSGDITKEREPGAYTVGYLSAAILK